MASSIRDRNLTPYLLSGSWICHPSFNWNYVVPCPVDSEVPSAQSWLPMDAFELCRQPQHPFLSLVHGLNRVLKAVSAQCQQVSTLYKILPERSVYIRSELQRFFAFFLGPGPDLPLQKLCEHAVRIAGSQRFI